MFNGAPSRQHGPVIDSARTAIRSEPSDLLVPGAHGPVPVRVYWGAGSTAMLWCHGGAFVAGDLDMPEADWTARRIVELTGTTVVTPDYRLATPVDGTARWPVRWPVPSDDVVAAWAWLVERAVDLGPDGLYLGGASAGANLATGALLRLRVDPAAPALPTALFLAYPTLHAVQPEPSADLVALLEELPADQRWGPEAVLAMYGDLLGPDLLEDPPIVSTPGHTVAADLEGFPPTLVLLSETDGLRPSGEGFAAALAQAGVPTRVHTEPGTVHGHLNRPEEPGAERSLAVVADWIGSL